MKTRFVLLVAVILLSGILSGPAWSQDEWLKKAELGPYAPAAFDEKQLYEKAKGEKEVAIYSYSSRVHQFAKTFEAQYPGIKVKGFDMDSAPASPRLSSLFLSARPPAFRSGS